MMGYVTFVGMQLPDRIQVDIDPDAEVKLLDVAVKHGIPLPCDCMQGYCGSCAVKVAPLFSAPQMTRLSLRERYFCCGQERYPRHSIRTSISPTIRPCGVWHANIGWPTKKSWWRFKSWRLPFALVTRIGVEEYVCQTCDEGSGSAQRTRL